MRSRFCAFYLAGKQLSMIDYLFDTHHPDFREDNEKQSLATNTGQQEWLSLKIIGSTKGGPKDDKGTVEFTAFFRQPDNPDTPLQLHENSNFIKENDRWFYTDGKILPPTKLKRNDTCWCGSGKKLKQCHPA